MCWDALVVLLLCHYALIKMCIEHKTVMMLMMTKKILSWQKNESLALYEQVDICNITPIWEFFLLVRHIQRRNFCKASENYTHNRMDGYAYSLKWANMELRICKENGQILVNAKREIFIENRNHEWNNTKTSYYMSFCLAARRIGEHPFDSSIRPNACK